MKLLKLILLIFAIYFIRRLFQMYKVMKEIQRAQDKAREEQLKKERTVKATKEGEVVDADYKVIDS